MASSNVRVTSSSARKSTAVLGSAACLLAVVVMGVLWVFTRPVVSANPASRIATIDALVHEHTYMIDGSRYKTIDRVVIDGHSYSSKPPVYSTLGAGAYWVLHKATGLSLRSKDGKERKTTLVWLTYIIAGLPFLVLLRYGYGLVCWMTDNEAARMWSFASLGLGQLGLAYSTTVNNHAPASALVVVAFYYAYGMRHGHLDAKRIRNWLYAGLAAGLAPTIDLGAALFSLSTGLYLMSFDWRRTLAAFAVAGLLPLGVQLYLTWQASGSVLPYYLRKELYDYEGSWWRNPKGVDALSEPRLRYFLNATLGHHGLISMTPTLIFSLIVLVKDAIRRERGYFAEALAVSLPLIVMVTYYTLMTKNYGGACAGFRWFLPAVPLTLVFTARWLTETRSRAAFGFFAVCLLISQYHTFSALGDPWVPSRWEAFVGDLLRK